MREASLTAILRDPNLLLELEPEELGGYIIAHLNTIPESIRENSLPRDLSVLADLGAIPPEKRELVIQALSEAWQWLEVEGLIVPRHFGKGFSITRRGRRLKSHIDVAPFLKSRALPRTLLHPRLVQRVWAAVLRGDYESAIFQAFREVEIGVREAAGLRENDLGVVLMRKAFDKNTGPLSRPEEPEAEREALSHLFAGAIGRFKNPASHRSVEYTLKDAGEALILASLLLRIVDERDAWRNGAS